MDLEPREEAYHVQDHDIIVAEVVPVLCHIVLEPLQRLNTTSMARVPERAQELQDLALSRVIAHGSGCPEAPVGDGTYIGKWLDAYAAGLNRRDSLTARRSMQGLWGGPNAVDCRAAIVTEVKMCLPARRLQDESGKRSKGGGTDLRDSGG
jgi:hypothetical protein